MRCKTIILLASIFLFFEYVVSDKSSSSDDYSTRCCPPGYTGLMPYDSCTMFFPCENGTVHHSVPQSCVPGTIFDYMTQACDFPSEVNCGTAPSCDGETSSPSGKFSVMPSSTISVIPSLSPSKPTGTLIVTTSLTFNLTNIPTEILDNISAESNFTKTIVSTMCPLYPGSYIKVNSIGGVVFTYGSDDPGILCESNVHSRMLAGQNVKSSSFNDESKYAIKDLKGSKMASKNVKRKLDDASTSIDFGLTTEWACNSNCTDELETGGGMYYSSDILLGAADDGSFGDALTGNAYYYGFDDFDDVGLETASVIVSFF